MQALHSVRQADKTCASCKSKWGHDCHLNPPSLMDEDGMVSWPGVDDTNGCMQWELCEVWAKLPVCDTCHKKIPIDAKMHHHGQADRCDQCEQYLEERG